jgi:hypothetical protein
MGKKYKEVVSPYYALMLYCMDLAVAEYISGRMSFNEAIDYCSELADKYSETEEFNKIVEEYYDKFVDIKDITLGEKNIFTGGN